MIICVLKPDSAEVRIGPEDIAGALKERLEVYRRTKVVAETEGNVSKARRYGRICKQFEDAIKLYARGKSIPLDELPVPPGFPPLSSNSQDNNVVAPSPPKPVIPENNSATSPVQPKPVPPPRTGKKNSEILHISCSIQYILLFIFRIKYNLYFLSYNQRV